MLVIAVIVLFLSSVFCEVEVKITKGILKGQILKSRNERPYYSFTGIPYAKPPIRKLRFEVSIYSIFIVFQKSIVNIVSSLQYHSNFLYILYRRLLNQLIHGMVH